LIWLYPSFTATIRPSCSSMPSAPSFARHARSSVPDATDRIATGEKWVLRVSFPVVREQVHLVELDTPVLDAAGNALDFTLI
jgi:hypothetical protein